MTTQMPDRLLTAPLVVFLLLVFGVVAAAVAFRHESPDLEGAIELLADGDFDRDERKRMLLHVIELGDSSSDLRGRWAATLAAVSLRDRETFDRFEARLGEGPERVLATERQHWLALGDAALQNVLTAMMTEASGDGPEALVRWRRVAAQARLTANQVAANLAAEAQKRLQ